MQKILNKIFVLLVLTIILFSNVVLATEKSESKYDLNDLGSKLKESVDSEKVKSTLNGIKDNIDVDKIQSKLENVKENVDLNDLETTFNNLKDEFTNSDTKFTPETGAEDYVGDTEIEDESFFDAMSVLTEGESDVNDEYITGDIYELKKGDITIEKNVNGNIYIIGKNVTIYSENIYGNIFVLAEENLTIASEISGSIYCIAPNFEFAGKASDIYLISTNAHFANNSKISRDLRIISENANMEGKILGSVYSEVGAIDINDETATINGTLNYTGELNTNSTKIGNIVKHDSSIEGPVKDIESIGDELSTFLEAVANSIVIIFTVLRVITIALILGIIIAVQNKNTLYATDIKDKFGKDLLFGLLFTVAIPVGAILFMITIIGIPVSLIVLLAYFVFFNFVNTPVAVIEISKLIFKNEFNSKIKIWLVAIALYVMTVLLNNVPWVGAIVNIVISMYGFGFVLRKIFGKKEPTQDVTVEVLSDNE